MSARSEVLARIKQVCKTAEALFNVNLKHVTIEIRNCGRSAGIASAEYFGTRVGNLKLVFNQQLVNEADKHKLIDDTIPHEIAHLVCYLRPELGKNHDKGWKRICKLLGGTGDRCHKYDLKKARRTRKAIYDINGFMLDVGLTVHRKIQSGARYSYSCRQTRRKISISPDHFTGKVVMK